MRIKSLQVHGFKSFVDRTVFTFEDGITAVVGPNGCGKSNVVDAVRWVMGEQSARRLRGKGMDDVIFAGAENRPPIGMAEVILTFDNRDGRAPSDYAAYAEIELTRRLYRSGESEYLINKVPSRLRDVLDFFRDTGIGTKGYTIVEQGRIAEIVSARAEDRRILIEEAAGISKYKARRREAESKIASTEQNLVRVTDVLGEIRRQISSLERQAQKAARYKRLRETLRVLELSLAADERRDLQGVVHEAGTRLTELRDRVTAETARLSQRELAVEEKRIALAESEKEVARGAERLYGLRSEIKQLEGRIELAQREGEGLVESNEGRRRELEQLAVQLRTAEEEATRSGEELRLLEEAVASESDAIRSGEAEVAAARDALRAAEREREVANEGIVEVLTAIARIEDRGAAVDDRRAELDRRVRSADQELEVHQSQAADADRDRIQVEEGLRNLLADRDRLQEQLLRAMKIHDRAVEDEAAGSEQLRLIRETHEARKARFDSLREVVERREDLTSATRHLLGEDGSKQRFGVRGLVRELLEVEPRAERAVEAVLAERAGALVVERPENALSALAELRRAKAGRGVFLVQPPAEPSSAGIVPLGMPLLEQVKPHPGFEALVRGLLGAVQLVEGLEAVLERYGSGRLPATFVTEDGDLLSPDGMISGGGESAEGGVLTRVREVRELQTEVAELARQVTVRGEGHERARAELVRSSDELDNLRNRHHTAALAVANREKDLERTSERIKALGEVHEGRIAERSGLMGEEESLTVERERLARDLEVRRSERATRQRDIDSLGLRISSAGRELSRFEARATELRVAHQGRVETRDRLVEVAERAAAMKVDTTEWIERREREIAAADERGNELREQARAAEQELAIRLEDEERARVSSEGQREQYEREAAGVRSLEAEARGARSELAQHRERVAEAELATREAELRLRHLDESSREKWEVDLASWTPPSVERGVVAESGEASQALREARANAELALLPSDQRTIRLEEVRRNVNALGEVNLGAIEEHEELAERFRFLSDQKQDLESTIHSLQEAIARINRTSRRRFRETFEEVSKRFSENFPAMFGGGRGSLHLTESEDVLEAGIEIMAMPPGKRLQNVNLLSGGEKTMTAIALLVAVFQVRPSPFFLLDEVDAALDDANVGRFNQLISELASNSQFLVITHNRRTIEVANTLYGVTMEQKGVSKLVAVELH